MELVVESEVGVGVNQHEIRSCGLCDFGVLVGQQHSGDGGRGLFTGLNRKFGLVIGQLRADDRQIKWALLGENDVTHCVGRGVRGCDLGEAVTQNTDQRVALLQPFDLQHPRPVRLITRCGV